jgi:Mlc titration factor MtfA (ptsG expression regulator)
VLGWNQASRRKRLLAEPFPEEWLDILARNVGYYRWLTPDQQEKLRNDARIFVAEKHWEGCNGLTVTEEMQVTIAANICLMLLGLEHDYFSRVRTILVYPSYFMLPDPDGHEDPGPDPIIAGQAVRAGPVILSWDSVLEESRDPSYGENLVIHEFAHQLDFLDGYLDGTLDLTGAHAERWQETLEAEFGRLHRRLRKGRNTLLGEYAATNKTEFFAVASERFFTRPDLLQRSHDKLYAGLVDGYGVDPLRWLVAKEGGHRPV